MGAVVRAKHYREAGKNPGGFVLAWVGERGTHEQNPAPKRSNKII